ncbi:MAG: damage-control phosphatase ARMT1 family protein [Thermodesulfobacteriota bacterium]
MRPNLDCAPCILKWVYERAGILATEKERFQLIRRISEILAKEFDSETHVGALSNRITDSIGEYLSQSARYYEKIKRNSNQLVRQLLPCAKEYIEKGRSPKERFKRACRLASASNVAPMTVPREAFRFQEAVGILRERKHPLPPLIGDFFETIQKAPRILYLTDNAGEIGFDALLIAVLKDMGAKVNLVVKQDPFFEDATIKDALFFSMDQLVDNIFVVNGFFLPENTASQLSGIFKESDLLIAKGTGNYEALKDQAHAKTTLYMLKVKCKPIAMNIGAPVGTFVVKSELAPSGRENRLLL